METKRKRRKGTYTLGSTLKKTNSVKERRKLKILQRSFIVLYRTSRKRSILKDVGIPAQKEDGQNEPYDRREVKEVQFKEERTYAGRDRRATGARGQSYNNHGKKEGTNENRVLANKRKKLRF